MTVMAGLVPAIHAIESLDCVPEFRGTSENLQCFQTIC